MRESIREKADRAKQFRCKNLIAVLENPKDLVNIGSVVRNVDALGVHKLYVIDGYNLLPEDWKEMRGRKKLNNISVSAIKWTFVKRYSDTQSCVDYLKLKGFTSIATSPHLKGKKNFNLYDSGFTNGKVAVWFGNESKGLSKLAIDNAEYCVNIEMCGMIESINLGTSSGIILHHAAHQRRRFLEDKKAI